MSKSISRSKRPIPSNSLGVSMPTSISRPFLNMINPMNSNYHGYVQANQSIVEETGEDGINNGEDVDLEAGRSTIFHGSHEGKRLSTKSQGKRRVAWNPGTSEMSILHPNIHKEDKMHEGDSSDDEVPPSFLIEAASHPIVPSQSAEYGRGQALYSTQGIKLPPTSPKAVSTSKSKSLYTPSPVSTPPQPRPSQLNEEPIPGESNYSSSRQASPDRQHKPMRGLDDYEKALWNWVNVYNLDAFLQEVYYYYDGKGIYSIALSRGLNLLTIGFVIGFSTFLLGCIDYNSLRRYDHGRLSDIIVARCVSRFSGFSLLLFLLFITFYIWQIIAYVMGIMRLVDMYNFYTYLLKIPDADIQTISWSEVVRRIGAIREDNPLTAISSNKGRNADDTTTAKLDAHDIANRIMRQENYLIALFNKDLLDLRVPWPRAINRFRAQGKGKVLTQALEWNLRFCLMEYLFDEHGKVRKVFLKSKNRMALIEGLKRRFIFMGILNAIFAPSIVLYVLMYSFFRYFEQYHKDPSAIGGRRYTSFASWKFREFNELPHIFTRRLDESYPLANMYIGQFPNEKMTHIMRFVAFIAGSFAAVLVLATVIDPDLFLHFEITPHRTIVFYIGIFGAILTVARGIIPEDNRVFDPELLMTEVIMYTHYMPEEWKNQLHSKKVHQEFGELFAMKILIFAQELISVVLTPFVLWFSLPACAPAIVDFFREFSVHVDGRGYVCSFAEFNFERHGNVKFGAPTHAQDKRMVSNEGKMEKSFLNFKATNPDWNPTDHSGSLYLSRMIDFNAHHIRRRHHATSYAGGSDMAGTVHFASDPPQEGSADMTLRESKMAAAVGRRRGLGGSVMGMSGMLSAGAGPVSAASVIGDLSTAPSAVLGDSQGSIKLSATSTGVSRMKKDPRKSSEEIAVDDGVASGLGESYVDGAKRYVGKVAEEEENLEDGGVLGLLAQIYGRRDGPAVVM